MKLIFILFIIYLTSIHTANSQSVVYIDTTILSNSTLSFNNNSLIDYRNNLKIKKDYYPFFGEQFLNFCSSYIPAFELIDTLSFKNISSNYISNFYFFLNDNKTVNLDSLTNQIFDNCNTEKEKSLAIFKYVQEHHLYSCANDKANPIYENYDASKFLNVYGNGNCGMIANAASQLSALYSGKNQRHWFVQGGGHGISELNFDSTYSYVDADEGGLYYLPDNKTLASFYDVFMDSHLYLRTKHFGAATNYNYDWNLYFNEFIRGGSHYINNTDTSLNINQPCCPKLNGLLGKNIDFKFKPYSSILFIPNDTMFINHFVHTEPPPAINTVLLNIGKGIIVSDLSANSNSISPALSSFQNLNLLTADSSYIPSSLNTDAFLFSKEESPYVISNADLQFSYKLINSQDSIQLYFSKDSINWILINWTPNVSNNYSNTSLNLYDYILPNSTEGCYSYFIKIKLKSINNINDTRIKNLSISSTFQYNKLTGPKLESGMNNLKLFSSNNDLINLKIKWKEYYNNNPPLNNITPIFPLDSSFVDSSFFTFKWTIPTDPENDSIVDYHIQVFDNADMRFPINPLFNRYLKLTNNGLAEFKPEVIDFLNHNTNYYWRIRSQDQKGIWSAWSNTFTFKVKTPMYPKNLHWEILADSLGDILKLAWDQNKDGDSVFYYKVYGSSNILGFEANESKIYINTLHPNCLVHLTNARKRYRVRAIGENENTSSASFFINIPFIKTVDINTTFNFIDSLTNNLNCNIQPFPPVNIENRPLFYLYDSTKITNSGNFLTSIDTGKCIVDLCTKINQDTIRLYSIFLRIKTNQNLSPFVSKPSLLIWPKDTSMIYGNSFIHNGTKYIGFLNGHGLGQLSTLPIISSTASNLSNAGYYTINASNASSNSYNIVYQSGLNTVIKRPLLVIATDTTITYGTNLLLNQFNCIGYVNNDENNVFISPPILSSNYNMSSLPGIYPININQGHTKNYTLNYQNGEILVNKSPLSIIINNFTSIYGNQPIDSGISYIGFVNNEDSNILIQKPQINIPYDSLTYAGNYLIFANGALSDRYNINYTPGLLNIKKSLLNITINNSTSTYGEKPILNGYQISGYKNNDNIDSIDTKPTAYTLADSNSHAGNYTIIVNNGFDNNYEFMPSQGIHTINKSLLTIIPQDINTDYGIIPTSFNYSITGFKNSDNINAIDTLPFLTSNAQLNSNVGFYKIYGINANDNDYIFKYDTAYLEIKKAKLIIKPINSSSIYGTPPKLDSIIYLGFKNNDNYLNLSSTPSININADSSSSTGFYPIYFVDTTITSPNYNLEFNNGLHSILKKDLYILINNISFNYKDSMPPFSFLVNGFVNNDKIEDLDQVIIFSTTSTFESEPGIYPLTINDIVDNNYNVIITSGQIKVNAILPIIELTSVSNNENTITYIVKLTESGGELKDMGIELSNSLKDFNNSLIIPYKDLNKSVFPFDIEYKDSIINQKPNSNYIIRAYASNDAGKVYSKTKTLDSYNSNFLNVYHNNITNEINIQVGDKYLNGEMSFYSTEGKILTKNQITSNNMNISSYYLQSGIYYLKFLDKTKKHQEFRKIVVL